ncbi:MAG: Gfo/Idh/MocA family oxidoreductase [Alphaproteobacteria bacterium]|jgi:predicted dehydrogenase|nr:Gfo/Idh/MocA family oxidoreductase [Alphaproteobacteria bacterium]
MTEPIRWGILGASKFAREHMGPAIHMADNAELAALATSSPAKAAPFRALQPRLKVHGSYDALLADPETDAIYVPLPNHLHVEWTKKALQAGKHVLTEKPIAMRADEIDALIALRDKTGLLATEAYMIVHHPQWKRAREIVQSGELGRLTHVEGVFTYNNAEDTANVRNDPAKGGGGIPDIGVYTYGSTRWVTGQEPQAITHADLTFENGVDVIARVAARFDGFTAHFVNSMRLHPFQEMLFMGDAGWLRLTAPFNPIVFGEARLELRTKAGERTERFPADWHYKTQVENFGKTIREGDAYPWSLEDAKGTQAMIDAVFEKAGCG